MSWAALVARLALAALFAFAAATKLRDRSLFAERLQGFGVHGRAAALASVAAPAVELVASALLLVPVTARAGAALTLVLLAAFSAAVGRALARGERPDCGCFGAASAKPVSGRTLARNGALAGLATLVLIEGSGASLAAVDVTPSNVVIAVLIAAVVAQAWFDRQLLLQNGRLLERIRALEERGVGSASPGTEQGLPVDSVAPVIALRDLDGRPRTLDAQTSTEMLALIFSDTDCGACDALPSLVDRVRHRVDARIVVVTRGAPATIERLWRGAPVPVLVQEEREAVRAFEVRTVPSAVVIGPDGRVATETVSGTAAIEELLVTGFPADELEPVAILAGGVG